MKKTIKDYDLNGKTVIIRCDFNVPIKDGIITDDNRIMMSLETIKYVSTYAKVILMSHLGRVEKEEDKKNNSLYPVYLRLKELLGENVYFHNDTRGFEDKAYDLKVGDILLIENTRFEDINDKKESKCDLDLSKYWASFGDLFVNDAYGSSHRAHASTYGIPKFINSVIGFLVEKEVLALDKIINENKKPFTVILGGAKVSDKIGVIENLVQKADYILIGGGMAYTFLKAQGYNIGKSIIDNDSNDFVINLLKNYKDKIILPTDVVVGKEYSNDTDAINVTIDQIGNDDMGLDIGTDTILRFQKIIAASSSIIWNGPLGVFEFSKFENGTRKICEALASSKALTLVGGGDSAYACSKFGFKDKFYHISTGGGATLEYLEGKSLPGIEIIQNK